MSYSTSSPPGKRARSRNCSSAVRNSQSRKSSSGRPSIASSSVPGLSPNSAPNVPGATACTRITTDRLVVQGVSEGGGRNCNCRPNFRRTQYRLEGPITPADNAFGHGAQLRLVALAGRQSRDLGGLGTQHGALGIEELHLQTQRLRGGGTKVGRCEAQGGADGVGGEARDGDLDPQPAVRQGDVL